MNTTNLLKLTPAVKRTAIPAIILNNLERLAINPDPELTKESAGWRRDILFKSLADLRTGHNDIPDVCGVLESELLKVTEIITTSKIALSRRMITHISRILSRHLVMVLNRIITIEPLMLYSNGYYKVMVQLCDRGKRVDVQLIRNTGRNPHVVLKLSSEVKPNGCADWTKVKIEFYDQEAFVNSERVSHKLSDALMVLCMYGFGTRGVMGYAIPYTINGTTTLTSIKPSVYRSKK